MENANESVMDVVIKTLEINNDAIERLRKIMTVLVFLLGILLYILGIEVGIKYQKSKCKLGKCKYYTPTWFND